LTGGTISGASNYNFNINNSGTGTSSYIRFQVGGATKAYVGFDGEVGAILQNGAVSGYPYVNIASDGVFKYNNTNPFLHSGNYSSYALPRSGGSSYPMTGPIYVPNGSAAIVVSGAASAILFGSADDSSTFGQNAGTTYLRSGNTNLVHRKATTDYIIYDASNFRAGTEYVSITGTETISGAKTFTGTIMGIKYDNPRIGFYTAAGTLNGLYAFRSLGVPEIYHPTDGWKTLYHSGNLTKSVLTGLLDASGGYYLPLTGGTLTSTGTVPLYINSTYSSGQSVIIYQLSGTNKSQVGYGTATYGTWMYDYETQAYINIPPSATTLYWKNSNPFLHSGNYSSYALPLSGGTISSGSIYSLYLNNSASGAAYVGLRFQIGGTTYGSLAVDNSGSLLYTSTSGGVKKVWHEGNSNKSDVDWTCYRINAMANGSSIYSFSNNITSSSDLGGNTLHIGPTNAYGLYTWVAGSGNTFFQSGRHTGATRYDLIFQPFGGNVGIGTTSPGYKVDVNGKVRATIFLTGATDTNTADYSGLARGSIITSSLTADDGAMFYSGHKLWVWATEFRVFGTIVSTGDQVISSDINLKTHFKDITLTSEQIANAPAVSFDWKDGHGHSFGSIAQYWKPLVPEAVLGEEGSYTLAYGQLGTVLGINNGKAIFKLEQHETEQDKEIRKLREKVQKLEMDNLRLKARLGLEN
jgi:hypothetical protein